MQDPQTVRTLILDAFEKVRGPPNGLSVGGGQQLLLGALSRL